MSFRKLDNRVLTYCISGTPESEVLKGKVFNADSLRNPEILVEIFNDIIHNRIIEKNTFESLLARWKKQHTPPPEEDEEEGTLDYSPFLDC